MGSYDETDGPLGVGLGDAGHMPTFPHPDEDEGDEAAVERAALAAAWEPSLASETRERIARTRDHLVPLSVRLRSAAHRMITGCEADGTVRLPRDAAAFLAELMIAMADCVPVGCETFRDAFRRGWMEDAAS
jgi:hypothetical protein